MFHARASDASESGVARSVRAGASAGGSPRALGYGTGPRPRDPGVRRRCAAIGRAGDHAPSWAAAGQRHRDLWEM